MTRHYRRGAVVKGPDLFADNDYRPYVLLSGDSHSFSDEEGLYAAVTTTDRDEAVQLTPDDFASGGLPRESYVNPWTVVSIRYADIDRREGVLVTRSPTPSRRPRPGISASARRNGVHETAG